MVDFNTMALLVVGTIAIVVVGLTIGIMGYDLWQNVKSMRGREGKPRREAKKEEPKKQEMKQETKQEEKVEEKKEQSHQEAHTT